MVDSSHTRASRRGFLGLTAAAAAIVAASPQVGAKQRSASVDTKEWIIAKPSRGKYTPDCLRLEMRQLPALKSGEVLLRAIYLSIDPTSRNWLKLEPRSTPFPLAVGDVMVGQVISMV